MDGITHEIRNKIKCAVKAKLQEMEAYVDEELPDYIMVGYLLLLYKIFCDLSSYDYHVIYR